LIYGFVTTEPPERVKIGFCQGPHQLVWREQAISVHSPSHFGLLGVVEDGTRQQEKALHKAWAHCRHRGEWFNLTPELSQFLATLLQPFESTKELRDLAMVLREAKGDKRRPGFDSKRRLLLDRPNFLSLDATSGISDQGETLTLHETLACPDLNPEELFLRQEAIANATSRNSAGAFWKDVMDMRLQGFSFQEIGAAIGKSEDAAQKIWSRVKLRLVERFQ
jgi:hypothetical protein